ncbi:BTAD domain-containing putative transcriptional regulator [Actinophytocola sp.]|uniref:BTAD domain-containing putative transcriptional regulator n=1 Tax=Actinophytocola sp. TaxID=1872138 RepID=UPI00389AD34E
MNIALLGEVTAHVDQQEVILGPARQRCVLAALAVDAGRLVSVERLVERVWGADTPRRGAATLHSHISRLRGAFAGALAIVHRSNGYTLEVRHADHVVDLLRFRALRDQARGAGTSTHMVASLTEALALWRGEPMTGLSGEWVEGERDRWRQERRAVEHDLIDARLRIGHGEELVTQLCERTARHPLDERVAGQYMLALHRAGRSADALDHYRQLREHLVEELGTDPGAALRALHRQILAADPDLIPTPAVTATEPVVPRRLPAPPSPPAGRGEGATRPPKRPPAEGAGRQGMAGSSGATPLVGRATQLKLLDDAVAAVLDGQFVVVQVCGEAGLGKTRVLAELGQRVAAAGLLVRSGRGTQFEQEVPFGIYADMVEPITPEPVIPLDEREISPERRLRMDSRLRRMLAANAATGVALLLDDMHWADSASLELTEHLVRTPPPVPLLLTVAFRGTSAPARLVNAIARLGAVAVLIDLPPLGSADLEVLLADTPRHRRSLIARASGGNPLYVQALSRLPDHTLNGLATLARPQRPVDANWVVDSQGYVLAGLAAEITTQEQAVQTVAHVAAIAADHTTIDLVAHVAALPMEEVTSAVDQLVRMGLIEADGARMAFRHPLMRAAAYALTGPAWRFEAHTRTADYLRARRASRQIVAHHTEQSARYGDQTAVATLAEAGILYAHEAPAQAARWLGTALRIMPDGGPRDERRAAVALWYARTLGRSGELNRCREVLQQLTRPDSPVRVQAETFSVAIARQLGDFAEAAATLNAQLARELDPLGEAKLRTELSAVDAFRENPTAAVHHAQRALELLDRDQPVLVATAHTLRALGALYSGSTTSARQYLTEAIDAVDAVSDAELRPYLEIISPLALAEIQLGVLHDAARHLTRSRRVLDTLGPSSASPYLLVMETLLHTRTGDLPRAIELGEEATAAAERVGSAEMCAMATAVRLRPLSWVAGPAAALAVARGPADAPHSRAWWRTSRVELALAHVLNGDRRGCLELLADSSAPPSSHPPTVAARHALAAIALAGSGDCHAAEDASAQALAAAEGLAYERALAEFSQSFTAYRMRRPARAVALANDAAAGFAAAGAPAEAALSHHLAGAAHRTAGRLRRCDESFDRAEAGYTACGAAWLSTVLANQRRPTSIKRTPPRGAPLTAREWEIAELATTGLSNHEIATRLYLSRRTVESHLSRVFTKLEIHSRTAMAHHLADLARHEARPSGSNTDRSP